MKRNTRIVRNSSRLIKLRLYSIARESLLKYISTEDENSDAFALLSQVALIQGDIARAEHNLNRALLLDRSNILALFSKAYVYVFQNNYEEALRTYFTILSIDPANKLAKCNIERIKDIDSNKNKPSARKYLVYSNIPFTLKIAILSSFIFLTVLLSYLSVTVFYPNIRMRFFDTNQRQLREKLNDLYLFEGLDNAARENTQSITYSPQEVADMFAVAKKDIIKGDVNAAVIVINRVLTSDINIYLKEQFERLYSFITAPDYNTLKNNIAYTTLIEEPFLYIGGFVKWIVRVDSFETVKNEDGDENIIARVIVLSSNQKISEGIVEVIFDINTKLEQSEKLEIYARIESFDTQRKIPTLKNVVVKHLPN